MRAEYDPRALALYIYVVEPKPGCVVRSEERPDGSVVDYDEDGNVLGYEFLLSARLKVIKTSDETRENTGWDRWPTRRVGQIFE